MSSLLHSDRKTHRGFTLIELMIVVAIIAILSAIAIPAYTAYVARSKLTEAFSGLSSMSVAAQQYYQDNRTYLANGGNATTCPVPAPANGQNYGFSCSNVSATTFTFTAAPINGFNGPSYTIDQDGVKNTVIPVPSGWQAPSGGQQCWVRDQSGDC
ncbi:MAG: type IV pilin protein [Thiomonas sp.]